MPDILPEIVEAQELGVSLFAGEAELCRIDEVVKDAYNGELKPLYNHMSDLPGLDGAITPILPLPPRRSAIDSPFTTSPTSAAPAGTAG